MPTALVANPNAEIVERGDRTWILFGTHAGELATVVGPETPFETVRDTLAAAPSRTSSSGTNRRRSSPTA